MSKKILVISDREADNAFHTLADEHHQVVVGKCADALLLLAMEAPDVILFYAEYADRLGPERKKVATAFEDVKRSIGPQIKLIRLGFQPEQPNRNELYVELPIGKEEFKKMIN
jgi:hypothetical protein